MFWLTLLHFYFNLTPLVLILSYLCPHPVLGLEVAIRIAGSDNMFLHTIPRHDGDCFGDGKVAVGIAHYDKVFL